MNEHKASRSSSEKPALRGGLAQYCVMDAISSRNAIIPGGTFRFRDAQDVMVKPFRLGETAVTVAAYAKCVAAGACKKPKSGGAWCFSLGKSRFTAFAMLGSRATPF